MLDRIRKGLMIATLSADAEYAFPQLQHRWDDVNYGKAIKKPKPAAPKPRR